MKLSTFHIIMNLSFRFVAFYNFSLLIFFRKFEIILYGYLFAAFASMTFIFVALI